MSWNIFAKDKGNQIRMKETLWQLTPAGEKQVKNYEGSSNPRFTILSTMDELGPSTVEDIAKHSNVGQTVVEFNLRKMARFQPALVSTVGSGG